MCVPHLVPDPVPPPGVAAVVLRSRSAKSWPIMREMGDAGQNGRRRWPRAKGRERERQSFVAMWQYRYWYIGSDIVEGSSCVADGKKRGVTALAVTDGLALSAMIPWVQAEGKKRAMGYDDQEEAFYGRPSWVE